MSVKQYHMKCEVCGRSYIATRKGSSVCSNKCRAKKSRDKKATNTTKIIQSQRQTIRAQASVMRAVMPDPVKVEKLSGEVGKDLTEYKRSDGSHFYTDQDFWILIARINQLVFAEGTGNLLSELDTNMRVEALIRDFEKRFDCKFNDVKRSHPGIRPGRNDAENERLVIQYASLEYSQ